MKKKSLLLDESLSHQAIEDTPIEAENLTTAPVDSGCKVGIMPIETEEKIDRQTKKSLKEQLFSIVKTYLFPIWLLIVIPILGTYHL